MQAMTLRLPDDYMRELRLASTYTGESVNQIVMVQLRQYLDRPDVREQIRAGLAADRKAIG